MDKESYNIDDILSEVKKRREENEERLNGRSPSTNDISDKAEEKVVPKEQPVLEKKQIIPEDEAQKSVVFHDEEPNNDKTENTCELDIEQFSQNEHVVHVEKEELPDEQIDFLALADEISRDEPDETDEEHVKWRKTKQGKIIISIIAVLLVLILAAGGFAAAYLNGALSKVTGQGESYQSETTYDGMDFLVENFPTIDELGADEFYSQSYKDYLKWWYQNGDPVSSTHILNILLVGQDTRDENIQDKSRADSGILVSINVDTQTITLTSILRDMYVYYEIDGQGEYGKINAPAAKGGMKDYIRTIERYYKMQINNYVVVNFASFEKIIDTLGGVDVDITSREIYEINSHQRRYGNVTIKKDFDGTEGTMLLSGKQALAYCRIRKIDSDGARADRQKAVLLSLLEEVKDASTLDAAKVVNQLIDYVYTGYSKKELIDIGSMALSKGWLGYDTVTHTVPATENAKGGNFKTSSGGYRYGAWIWKADLPKDAYDLQMLVYGKSNITLAENRAKYVEIN